MPKPKVQSLKPGGDDQKPMKIAKGARKASSPFARIPDAIEAFRAGRMIIVVDDEDRENEGDLTIAAEKVTPDAINFMARYGRGLICLSKFRPRIARRPCAPRSIRPPNRPIWRGRGICFRFALALAA